MDWKAKVDLFEQLRREHEFGVGTIAGVAAKFGVHRRVVRRAIASALPPPHHYAERNKPKLGAVADFIDQVLAEDCRAPRKQRHTARRIHRRILTEFPDATVAESTVRNHVHERKRQMGLLRRETFVPQSYSWAQEAQVDWYEAWVDLGEERTKVQVFAMRSMPAVRRSTGPTCTPRSRHSWRRTSTPSITSAACFTCCATTTWPVRCARSCAAIGGKRRFGSWRSAHIGGLPLSSARPVKVMRRVALKVKAAIFGATIWYRYRASPILMR